MPEMWKNHCGKNECTVVLLVLMIFFFKCNCILTFLSISFCSFESFQNQRRSIIVAGACSENAIEYKKRLVFMEQIVPVIKYAMEQFPEHLGVQKQSLGLLHYLSGM